MKKIKMIKICLICAIIIFALVSVFFANETVSCIKDMKKSNDFIKEYEKNQYDLTNLKKVL
jgi:cell division protein FtsL